VASPTADEIQSAPRVRSVGSGVTDANVQNVTVTVWLDTETDLPVKARREIEVAKGDTTATVTVSYRFTDYDEPTAVTGPNLAEKNSWTSGCPGS